MKFNKLYRNPARSLSKVTMPCGGFCSRVIIGKAFERGAGQSPASMRASLRRQPSRDHALPVSACGSVVDEAEGLARFAFELAIHEAGGTGNDLLFGGEAVDDLAVLGLEGICGSRVLAHTGVCAEHQRAARQANVVVVLGLMRDGDGRGRVHRRGDLDALCPNDVGVPRDRLHRADRHVEVERDLGRADPGAAEYGVAVFDGVRCLGDDLGLLRPCGDTHLQVEGRRTLCGELQAHHAVCGVCGLGLDRNLFVPNRKGGRAVFKEVDDHAVLVAHDRTAEEDADTCRADADATAVVGIVLQVLQTADLLASLAGDQGAVAVEGEEDVDEVCGIVALACELLSRVGAGLVLGVECAEICVVEGLLDAVGKDALARETQKLRAVLHPGDGDAGLLHDALVEGGLTRRRVVEQLVRASAGADDGHVGVDDRLTEVDGGDEILFDARDAVIFDQTLKAGDRFVRLRYAVLIGRKLVFVCQLENVDALGTAVLDDVGCEIKVTLFARQAVEPDHRLKDRGGVDASPVTGSDGDRLLSLSVSDEADDVVGHAAQELHDLLLQRLVLTDVVIVFHAEEYVLPAPKVPCVEFGVTGERGNAAVLLRRREHIAHRFGQHVIEGLVVRVFVDERRAAHHLAPVFASPAAVVAVDLVAELLYEALPEGSVTELLLLEEACGPVGASAVRLQLFTERAQVFRFCGNDNVFHGVLLIYLFFYFRIIGHTAQIQL